MMKTIFSHDPPRVFISYTRRCLEHGDTTHRCTDPNSCQTSVALAAQLAQALEARGFVPLWDKERLEVGDVWRDELVDMLDACDAAIVLLSGPAIDSDWVLQEATILKYRHDSGGLHLLPVVLPGFRASQLADGRFAPLHLEAVQMLATTAFTDPSPGVDALMDVLGIRFADWNEDRVELRLKKHIRAKLGGIDESLLDLMMDDLTIARSWIQHERLRRLVVREVADALLEVGVKRAAHVLGTLVSHIDERNLKDVLRWVEPFWVDRRAARAIRRDPVGKAFAVNACLGSTAVSYLARATCDQVPWTYAEVLSITGEEHDSELKQRVLAAFAAELGVQPAEVPEALALELADGPVFVVLSDHVADRVLAQLRRDDELRGLSFLVLTGEARRPDLPDWPGDLELIEPPLEPGAELQAARDCQDARDRLKVIIHKLRRAQAAAS